MKILETVSLHRLLSWWSTVQIQTLKTALLRAITLVNWYYYPYSTFSRRNALSLKNLDLYCSVLIEIIWFFHTFVRRFDLVLNTLFFFSDHVRSVRRQHKTAIWNQFYPGSKRYLQKQYPSTRSEDYCLGRKKYFCGRGCYYYKLVFHVKLHWQIIKPGSIFIVQVWMITVLSNFNRVLF